MWRSVLLGVAVVSVAVVVWAGVLAARSGTSNVSPGPSSGDGIPQYGVVEGRVVTTACGGLLLSGGCGPTPYRGSLAFCTKMGQHGICPSAGVDATGHYRIVLRPGRHALMPAPGNGNVVQVKPRWVVVVAGQTRTLNINGGNLMR